MCVDFKNCRHGEAEGLARSGEANGLRAQRVALNDAKHIAECQECIRVDQNAGRREDAMFGEPRYDTGPLAGS